MLIVCDLSKLSFDLPIAYVHCLYEIATATPMSWLRKDIIFVIADFDQTSKNKVFTRGELRTTW